MHRSTCLRLAAGLVALAAAGLAPPAMAQAAPAASAAPAAASGATAPVARLGSAQAAERCESAVAETIRTQRGRNAQEVVFTAGRRSVAPLAEDETGVRGEGRYRNAAGRSVNFNYSCAFNFASNATSGVVIREVGGTAAAAPEPAWQPDLTSLSPEACESAVAAELKRRHPRVEAIALDASSRRVGPGANNTVVLQGNGAMKRAPGMNAAPMRYACDLDARGTRVLAVRIED